MAGELVVGIGQLAAVDGQAAASDAVGEVVAQLLEVAYPLVEFGLPALGYPLPVAAGGSAAVGEQCEDGGDVGERDTDAHCDADQRHAAQRVPLVATLVA